MEVKGSFLVTTWGGHKKGKEMIAYGISSMETF
jgi:hypothetical protein